MVLKSMRSVRKGEGDYGGKDLWKSVCWVWSGREKEWCEVKVVMMMMMMIIHL